MSFTAFDTPFRNAFASASLFLDSFSSSPFFSTFFSNRWSLRFLFERREIALSFFEKTIANKMMIAITKIEINWNHQGPLPVRNETMTFAKNLGIFIIVISVRKIRNAPHL